MASTVSPSSQANSRSGRDPACPVVLDDVLSDPDFFRRSLEEAWHIQSDLASLLAQNLSKVSRAT